VCLAENVGSADGLERALRAYNEQRALRTARLQLQSREIGQHIYHPAGAHAALRNQLMKAKSAADWYDTLDWLYGGPPERRARRATR